MPFIQFPENFMPASVRVANNLITPARRSPAREPLTAHKPASAVPAIDVKRFGDFDQELAWLAEALGAVPVAERPKCVVLARRKKLLEDIVNTLVSRGVPAYLAIRKNEFTSAPYRFHHEMLRLANARQSIEHSEVERAYTARGQRLRWRGTTGFPKTSASMAAALSGSTRTRKRANLEGPAVVGRKDFWPL